MFVQGWVRGLRVELQLVLNIIIVPLRCRQFLKRKNPSSLCDLPVIAYFRFRVEIYFRGFIVILLV